MDTNSLLVYFIGNYDYATGYHLVNESRYTRDRYDPEDFDILNALFTSFNVRITIPHILAGASGFCIGLLRNAIPALRERNVPAIELARDEEFLDFGVADMSIIKTAASVPCLTLTDNFKLSGYRLYERKRNGHLELPRDQIQPATPAHATRLYFPYLDQLTVNVQQFCKVKRVGKVARSDRRTFLWM